MINTEENNDLIKREPIDGTPFIVVWTPEKKWFATYRNYQLTKSCDTKEEVIAEVNYNTWHIILLMIQIVVVETENLKAKVMEGDKLEIENKNEQKQ